MVVELGGGGGGGGAVGDRERAKMRQSTLQSQQAGIQRRAADAETDPEDEEDWRTALNDIRREVLSR